MSIQASFAGPPEELAILVALAVQSRGLAVRVFNGSPAEIGASEECNVHVTAFGTEEL